MTVRDPTSHSHRAPNRLPIRHRGRLTGVLRLACAGLLGVAAALLVSCGGSGKGLIPTGDAGPLQGDFEAVAQAAENGNGSCAATAEAIRKTEHDFGALPATLDAGLHGTLERGIANLRSRALSLCAQPLAQTTTSASPPSTTVTQTTTATPPVTTSTQTTPPSTTPTTSGPGGGTPAPTPEASPGVGEPQGGAGAGEEGSPGGQGSAGGSGDGGRGRSDGGSPGAGQEAGK